MMGIDPDCEDTVLGVVLTLGDADIRVNNIDYVSAHATLIIVVNLCELNVMERVFR